MVDDGIVNSLRRHPDRPCRGVPESPGCKRHKSRADLTLATSDTEGLHPAAQSPEKIACISSYWKTYISRDR